MSPERWAEVRRVFDGALDLAPEERPAYLAAVDDAGLRREVEELLASFEESDNLLTRPAPARLATLLETRAVLETQDIQGGPAAPREWEGRLIGPYRLLRKLASGGMGQVYVAARADLQFEKQVAIKFVRAGMDTDSILQRFRQERQVLAELDHPNIARLLDGGSTPEGLPYLVMEYVEDGVPVDVYCDARRLGVRERLRLFLPICAAVQYAHQNLIVHRDIKPPNILITQGGDPKLLDFGIAKLLGPAVNLTVDSVPMTPEYASPEQVRNEAVTTSTDVYALGVLLYRLLTGRLPYDIEAKTAPQLFVAIVERDPRRPSTVDGAPRELAGDLDVILLTALQKDPARRYASVERFADDIRRYLDGLPVAARGDSFAYKARKFVARNRAAAALTAAFTVGLIGATITSVHYARVAQRDRTIAERRFQDVRQLARFVLFEFDDAIRSGETNARRVLVRQGVEYLNRLAPEAVGDKDLLSEVARAYLKVGDIQGNPLAPNVGDSEGAAASYREAARLAALAGDTMSSGSAQAKLGDLALPGGNLAEARQRYAAAIGMFESPAVRDSRPAREALLTAYMRMGELCSQAGEVDAALAHHERALAIARAHLEANPSGALERRGAGRALMRVAQARVARGDAKAALSAGREALAHMRANVDAQPGRIEPERDLMGATAVLAEAAAAAGELGEAASNYQRAVELAARLRIADPANLQYSRQHHVFLSRLAGVHTRAGKSAEARAATAAALAALEPLVNGAKPNGYDLQQYVWILVTTPYPELRNPARALPYARRSVEITKRNQPSALDALARALMGTGNAAEAVRVEEEALALLPPNEQSEMRRELEANLAAFRRGEPAPADHHGQAR